MVWIIDLKKNYIRFKLRTLKKRFFDWGNDSRKENSSIKKQTIIVTIGYQKLSMKLDSSLKWICPTRWIASIVDLISQSDIVYVRWKKFLKIMIIIIIIEKQFIKI